MFDKYQKASRACPDKKEREEIEMLKTQVCFQDFKIKRAKIRNRYNQAPHLTQDTTWESDKNTIKQHIQES